VPCRLLIITERKCEKAKRDSVFGFWLFSFVFSPDLMPYVIVPSGAVSASVHANVTSTPTAVLSGNDLRTKNDGQLGFVFSPEIT
jgi:hypothetical protein